jgi:hypothetical protein
MVLTTSSNPSSSNVWKPYTFLIHILITNGDSNKMVPTIIKSSSINSTPITFISQ